MEPENIYCNSDCENDINSIDLKDLSKEDISTNTNTDDTQKLWMNFIQNEAVRYKRSRWFAMVAALIGLICVLLVATIILVLYFHLTLERDVTVEREEQQKYISFISQKEEDLENQVEVLSDALRQSISSSGSCWYYISTEKKSWFDSRQFCRDICGDLVIINTEEEQRYISSIAMDRVWIGLSDIAGKGIMTWVDNSTLNNRFWDQDYPNYNLRNESCVEMRPLKPILNNWNNLQCLESRKWICEVKK
ncbi:uncharacterized protein [Paramisgurnus dabryanus]|uniref:uncharacterized protein isoform X2 n=1 Tax=Paramisgurnus dabryanus TaxID=90735 RepID=UPI003CCF8546